MLIYKLHVPEINMGVITASSIEETRKQIDSLVREKKPVIVMGSSIAFNRLILENKKVNMLVLSHENKKGKLKQRDSGLNHILCHIAKENDIVLTIDINELKNKEKKEKALILARMMQNIKLIKKAGNKFKLLNYSNKPQAFSFLLTLGAGTELAKNAVS